MVRAGVLWIVVGCFVGLGAGLAGCVFESERMDREFVPWPEDGVMEEIPQEPAPPPIVDPPPGNPPRELRPPASDPPDPSLGPAPAPSGPAVCNAALLPPDSPVCVVFPPPRSHTDQATITVRGVTVPGSDVALVSVNDILATSDDGFAHWRVEVPLVAGDNLLTVSIKDGSGQTHDDISRLRVRSDPFVQVALIWHFAVDTTANRALAVSEDNGELVAIELDTGHRRMISSPQVGDGRFWDEPVAFALARDSGDPRGGLALVGNAMPQELFAVDLATGDRVVASGATRGAGPALTEISAVAYDPASERAIVLDSATASVLAIDLDSGDRTVISGAGQGSGPALISPAKVTIDTAAQRALVVDTGYPAEDAPGGMLMWVDLITGARQTAGPVLVDLVDLRSPIVRSVALDPLRGRVLLALRHRTKYYYHTLILARDLASGTQTVLSATSSVVGDFGTGPSLRLVAGVAVDDNGRILAADAYRDVVYTVEPTSGDRVIPWASDDGDSGSRVVAPYSAVLDPARGRLLLVDTAYSQLVARDLVTGRETVLEMQGALSVFNSEVHAMLDHVNDRVWLMEIWDSEDSSPFQINSVDLRTGRIEQVPEFDPVENCFPDMPDWVVGVAPDIHSGHLLLLSQEYGTYSGYLATWAPHIGTCHDSIAHLTGSRFDGYPLPMPPEPQPEWAAPRGMAMDWANQRAVIVDAGTDTVFTIDRQTGERTAISGWGTGIGPELVRPFGVVMDARHNRAIVGDESLDALFGVDMASGDRKILTGGATGRGPMLGSPRAMAADSDNGLAFVVHQPRTRIPPVLMAVDLETGERVSLAP